MAESNRIVYLGGDTSVYELKEVLEKLAKGGGVDVIDLGVFEGDDKSFADMSREVAEKVEEGDENTFGVLVFSKQSDFFGRRKMEENKSEEKK